MRNTAVIMNDAMNCLVKNIGAVETEVFISNLLREPFDYTEWRRDKFDDMTLEELAQKAADFSEKLHENDN